MIVDGSDVRSLEPTLPGDGLTLDDAALTGGSGRPAWTEAEVPARIGRFVVERRLGVGGMGAVFEAHDPLLDRPVALKLLRGQARPNEQTRLRREAQALARLSHPHVVQVFEAGVHEGRAYIAMELVDGTSLEAWLAGQPRTPDAILDVFMQAG
jgi:serine/threonine protein kinase